MTLTIINKENLTDVKRIEVTVIELNPLENKLLYVPMENKDVIKVKHLKTNYTYTITR